MGANSARGENTLRFASAGMGAAGRPPLLQNVNPERWVPLRCTHPTLLDEGFAGNDQLKANAVQTFKTKGIVKFQTV